MPSGVPSALTGVILAGGLASRYGEQAKGLLTVGGERIIDRVAASLRAVTAELLLIANDPTAESWLPGVRTAPDVRPGLGSLGGIYSGLVLAGGAALVVAWDMPFVSKELLRELARLAASGQPPPDVVVPESNSHRGLEPLCAYYGPACVGAIARQLDAGDLRVIGLYDAVRVVRVPVETVRSMGDPDVLFHNVNTPADLELAERSDASSRDATPGHRRRQEA
jgi:molybdenum cofactor guanylyltransferase